MSARDHHANRATAGHLRLARRVALPAALLGVVVGLLGPAGTASAAATDRSTGYERAVIAHVNKAREAKGLRPLRVVPCADAVAEARAVRMRRTHRSAPVSNRQMLLACDRSLKLNAAALGPFTARALVRAWLEQRAARSVLLDRRARWVGLGAAAGRSRGWHVSLVVVGNRTGGAGGSVPNEEAAPAPGTSDDADLSDPSMTGPGADPTYGSGSGGTDTTTDAGPAGAGDGGDPAGSVPAGSEPAAEYADLQAAIFEETNRRRANHGLAPLEASACAGGFAAQHTAWMAESGELAHADLAVLRAECPAPDAAENIAVLAGSTPTARTVVQAWMDSPGHRANILDPDLTHLGVGVALDAAAGRWYATQDFLALG